MASLAHATYPYHVIDHPYQSHRADHPVSETHPTALHDLHCYCGYGCGCGCDYGCSVVVKAASPPCASRRGPDAVATPRPASPVLRAAWKAQKEGSFSGHAAFGSVPVRLDWPPVSYCRGEAARASAAARAGGPGEVARDIS